MKPNSRFSCDIIFLYVCVIFFNFCFRMRMHPNLSLDNIGNDNFNSAGSRIYRINYFFIRLVFFENDCYDFIIIV